MPKLLSDSFQRKILRLLIQDKQFGPFVSSMKESYFRGHLSTLFRLLQDFYQQNGRIPDELLLVEMVGEDPDLADELEFCLAEELPPPQDVVVFLKDFVLSHEVYQALESSISLLQVGKFGDIRDNINQALDKGLIGGEVWSTLFDDALAGHTFDSEAIPTPWKTITYWLDYEGLRPGEELVVLAPPKGYKSLVLMHGAVGCLIVQKPVLYISFELSKRILLNRFGRMFTGMNWIERELFPDTYKERIELAKKLTRNGLYVQQYPQKSKSPADLEAVIRAFERSTNQKLGLLVVDYGALMSPSRRNRGDVEELGDIYRDICAIGQRLEFGVWTAAQTGKETEDMEIIRAGHVWRSLEIVQAADYVITVGGKTEQKSRGFINFYLAYSRNSPMGSLMRAQVTQDFWINELQTNPLPQLGE